MAIEEARNAQLPVDGEADVTTMAPASHTLEDLETLEMLQELADAIDQLCANNCWGNGACVKGTDARCNSCACLTAYIYPTYWHT